MQNRQVEDGGKEQFFYVVADGAITHQSPRAWVFDTEEAAVQFRTEKIEMYSRRPCSLAPIYRVKVNATGENAMLEIDWRKYQLPKKEEQKKFM